MKILIHQLSLKHIEYLLALAGGTSAKEMVARMFEVNNSSDIRFIHCLITSLCQRYATDEYKSSRRFIGKVITAKDSRRMSFSEFLQSRDWTSWSESALLSFYLDCYPMDKKYRRRIMLRERLYAIFAGIEERHSSLPHPSDQVSFWFSFELSDILVNHSINSIGEFANLINSKARWYTEFQGIGKLKAKAIALSLRTLLPGGFSKITRESLPQPEPNRNVFLKDGKYKRINNQQLIAQWIEECSISSSHGRSLDLEAQRFVLWLWIKRRVQGLIHTTPEECVLYCEFLSDIPISWIYDDRSNSPSISKCLFTKALAPSGQAQARRNVSSLYAWLVARGYLESNPWKACRSRKLKAQGSMMEIK